MPETIHSHVAGVTHENADGTSREGVIRRCCEAGMWLRPIAEPGNPWDANAIGLWIAGPDGWWQVGYLPRALAVLGAAHLAEGGALAVRIRDVPGKMDGYPIGLFVDLEFHSRAEIGGRGSFGRRTAADATPDRRRSRWSRVLGWGCRILRGRLP